MMNRMRTYFVKGKPDCIHYANCKSGHKCDNCPRYQSKYSLNFQTGGSRVYTDGGTFWVFMNGAYYTYKNGQWEQYNGANVQNNLKSVYWDSANNKYVYYSGFSEIGQRVII